MDKDEIKVGDNVRPTSTCRPLVGDPDYLVVSQVKGNKIKTGTYSFWFDAHELKKSEVAEANKEYIVRVLSHEGFEADIEGNYVILKMRTIQGYQIRITPFASAVEVWLQSYDEDDTPNGAWVEVKIPIPTPLSSNLSSCIRWVVNKVLFHPR